MSQSDQQARLEQLWASAIRRTRRAVQIQEQELRQEETELRNELATWRDSPCAGERIQHIERTLRQRESTVQSELLKLEVAYRDANINLKFRGLDALLREHDTVWQKTGNYFAALTAVLQARNWGTGTGSASQAAIPTAPEFDNGRLETISRVAGSDSDIDLLLRSLGNVLKDYTHRKRRRRVVFVSARVLLFLGLVLLADGLLNLVQPFEFYLLAAVIAWFLDEYFIHPALDKRFEEWNVRVLQQTIGDFYRAQRRALYQTAALETHMRKANAVLDTTET